MVWLTEIPMVRIFTPVLRAPCLGLPPLQTSPTHKLFVKTLAGDTKTFKVSRTATVVDLKKQIQDRLGYAPEGLTLKHRGKLLQEGLTLARCGVSPEAIIRVVVSLSGDKPVILLYPPTQLKVSVHLALGPHWTFSALYPKPRGRMVQQSWNSQVRYSLISATLVRMPLV